MTFTCSAVDLPSTVLRWFLNGDYFALYALDETDLYPLPVQPLNATYNSQVGSVDIQILSASPNQDNQDIASFVSKMTVTISALQKAGISTVSCGSIGRRSTVNVQFDPNRGQFIIYSKCRTMTYIVDSLQSGHPWDLSKCPD